MDSCSDFYNYETDGDPTVLECSRIPDEEHPSILREEGEVAVKALKKGKSVVVYNIRADLVQVREEVVIDVLTLICI